jgi:hypothetical protein
MLTLDNESISQSEVPVWKNLLIGRELENEVDDFPGHIDVVHRKDEMLEITQLMPSNIAIVKDVSGRGGYGAGHDVSSSRFN